MLISEAKAGAYVVADGGFTCIPEGAILEIKQDNEGLYVNCEEGKHYLDGQYSYDGTERLIGFEITSNNK